MTDADAAPSESPSPVHAPTSEEIDAVIQMATSSRASPDGRPVPLKDTRTQLFVGNLPYRVRWQDLKDLFRKAGTVLRADVALGPDNRSRGYGSVLLATAEDAGRAVDMFNGYSWQTRVLEVRLDRLPSELNTDGFPRPGPYGVQGAAGLAANGLPMGGGMGMGTAGRSYGQMGAAGGNGQSSYAGTPSLLGADMGAITRTLFVGNLPFHVQWQDLKDLFRQAGTILRADVALGSDGRSRGFGTVVYATEADAERAVRVFNGYEFNGRALKVHFDKLIPIGASSPGSASPVPPAAISTFATLAALNTSTASAATSGLPILPQDPNSSLLVNSNGGTSLPISPHLSHAPSPNPLSGSSNSAALSRLMSLNNGAGSSALSDLDYDFAYTYDGLGAGTRDAFESAIDDVSSVFRPTSSSSMHNAFRPTSSSGTSTNPAFHPTSSSAAFRPTSSSSSTAFRPTSSSVNTFAYRPTSAGSPNTLAAQNFERLASIPLVASQLASAHSSDSQTNRPSHSHSQSLSPPKSLSPTQTAPRPETQSQLYAHSTGSIPHMNGSNAPAKPLRSELPTPPSSSGTGSSPNITLAKPAGFLDWRSKSSPSKKKVQTEAPAAPSALMLSRRPSASPVEAPREEQPRTPPRSQAQSQSHPHHPGPISLPPPSAFPLPAPHTLSPVSPYHHPHMTPTYMVPVMLPSPLHHPMHPHSPLHHPMHPHSPMHHPMHPQSPMHPPQSPMHPPQSPMHHPYAHPMSVPMSLMTPHGLPPMTPSMPSFQFHSVQHPHSHPTPHAMFSPGVTMSPGAFWGRPARRGSGWDPAVGAPVRPTTGEAGGLENNDTGANGGEWGDDYFASANPTSDDYFSGVGLVPSNSSSVIANEIMRDNRGEASAGRLYAAASGEERDRDREVDGVSGVIERMGGMDLAARGKGRAHSSNSNPRVGGREDNDVFWSTPSETSSSASGGQPPIQRAGSDPVQHVPAALGGTRSVSSGGEAQGGNGERRASFAQVVGGA